MAGWEPNSQKKKSGNLILKKKSGSLGPLTTYYFVLHPECVTKKVAQIILLLLPSTVDFWSGPCCEISGREQAKMTNA
jgi:hypothetical protein